MVCIVGNSEMGERFGEKMITTKLQKFNGMLRGGVGRWWSWRDERELMELIGGGWPSHVVVY